MHTRYFFVIFNFKNSKKPKNYFPQIFLLMTKLHLHSLLKPIFTILIKNHLFWIHLKSLTKYFKIIPLFHLHLILEPSSLSNFTNTLKHFKILIKFYFLNPITTKLYPSKPYSKSNRNSINRLFKIYRKLSPPIHTINKPFYSSHLPIIIYKIIKKHLI